MSEKAPIVQVRLPVKLRKKLDQVIAELNGKASARPWTRSSWIRWSIEMQIVIHEQRQKNRSKSKYKCKTCGKMKTRVEIAHQQPDLFGDIEYFCRACHPDQFYQNEPPPI
jgi:hypothetical protein